MINFDQLFRMVKSLYDIQLSMLGATMEQRRGVQACWDGVFKYMNELMKPFLVCQTGLWNWERQNPRGPDNCKATPGFGNSVSSSNQDAPSTGKSAPHSCRQGSAGAKDSRTNGDARGRESCQGSKKGKGACHNR